MIRVLAISNAYLEMFTRQGIVDKERFPEIEITAVVPRLLAEENPRGLENLEKDCASVRLIKTFFDFHHSVRAYGPGLLQLLKELRPDIVFINNEPWSTTVFETVLMCKMAGLKSRIVVYTCENLPRRYVFPFWLMEKYIFNNVDTMATITREEGAEILRKKGYRGRIDYLPLSVDAAEFKKGENFETGAFIDKRGVGKLVFGFIGRLVPEKGIATVLHALKGLDDLFHFVIIGGGPQKDELHHIVAALGIASRVTFIENVSHDDLPKYFNALDAVILPSLTTGNWKEQFGRVLVEAMACEVPVIGSSSGEIPEVVGNGGVIFREGDVDDLRAQLTRLKNSIVEREKLGKSGRKRVLERYDTKVVMAKTARIYKELLSNEAAH